MKRRNLVLAASAWPFMAFTAFAQQKPEKVWRIGFLSVASVSRMADQRDALRAGLRDLGYVEGRDLDYVSLAAEGRYERLRALASELVRRRVDLIVAFGTPATQAAKLATTEIPIVAVGVGDPVGSGLVASLARPGGNVTGTSNLSPPLMVKRFQLITDAVPSVRGVGVLVNAANPAQPLSVEAVATAARPLGIAVYEMAVRDLDGIRKAFEPAETRRIDAVVVANDTILIGNARAIAGLAAGRRIPSAGNREFAEAGGLIGYGSIADVYNHSAHYVDRIIRGAKPADLPVEQPTKFDIVFNLRAAKALGLAVPQSILLRADRVIE